MATPPTFVAEYETVYDTTTSPKTISVTVSTGEVLVNAAVGADTNTNLGSAPTGGTGVSWTLAQSTTTASKCAVITNSSSPTGQTFTLSQTGGANFVPFGDACFRFSGSDGIGASNEAEGSGSGPSVSLTTTADNSAVLVVACDWSAADGASRTWRTVNSYTPTSGNGGEKTYFRDSLQYTVYMAVYGDVGTAGTNTYGLSAPNQNWTIHAVEIKGSTGGGGGGLAISRLGTSTSYTTGTSLASSSVTVSEGDLIFVSITVSGGASATASRSTANIATSLGGSWSWTLAQVAPAAASSCATYVYRAQVPTGGGGTGTFTFTASASVTDSRVCVTKVTGHDTATPIVGDTTLPNTTSTSGSMTAGATPTTADALVGIISSRNDTNGMTVGTSFTSLSNEFDAATPSASQLIEYRTSTTSTTIDVSGMSTSSNNGVGFIVKASSGSNYSGSPALSGSGSLSATQQSVDLVKSVSLSGSGSLGVVAGVAASGSVSLSGSGTLTAAIIPKFAAAPAFSGSGVLSVVPGPPDFKASPSLSGSGTLTAAQLSVDLVKAVGFSGAGILAVSTTITTAGSASLSGSGTLTAIAIPEFATTASLSGAGNLTVTTLPGIAIFPGLSGSGILSTSATAELIKAVNLSGSGTLSIAAALAIATNISLSGSGVLSVQTGSYGEASPALSGSGILSAVSIKAGALASIALSGDGVLTVLGIPKLNQVASLLGSGILTVTEPNVYTNFWYNGSVWIPITFYLKG